MDALVFLANKHLKELEPRYRIERETDENNELGLLIRDCFEGGQTRPVSSLSGGETFLASLALALGVSDLARGENRIDTLFVDEGFGSLDPDCLEKAVGVLQELRHKNKTVGVISHVELLKDRISTQVEVVVLPEGKENCELAENIQTRGSTVVDSICPSHLLFLKMEIMICIIIGLLIGIYSELNSG